jgi:hypothetical protein
MRALFFLWLPPSTSSPGMRSSLRPHGFILGGLPRNSLGDAHRTQEKLGLWHASSLKRFAQVTDLFNNIGQFYLCCSATSRVLHSRIRLTAKTAGGGHLFPQHIPLGPLRLPIPFTGVLRNCAPALFSITHSRTPFFVVLPLHISHPAAATITRDIKKEKKKKDVAQDVMSQTS